MHAIPLVILAAGESSRLGRAKQLLELDNETLIEKVVRVGTESFCTQVIVVLGCRSEEIAKRIKLDERTHIIENPNWKEGMASSLRCAVNFIEQELPDCHACIFASCDQVLLDAAHLNLLIKAFEQDRVQIVASEYSETRGIPALFSRQLFGEIKELRGEGGAKSLIQGKKFSLSTVAFPSGACDIDNEADWKKYRQHIF